MSKYQISKQEHLFNNIILLKHGIQRMAGIVQNEGMEVGIDELNEWSESVNKLIKDIYNLKLEVIEFYE